MMEELTYFDGIVEATDFMFNMLEDERVYWNQFPSEYGKVTMIDKFTARLDAYMDDLKEQWNV